MYMHIKTYITTIFLLRTHCNLLLTNVNPTTSTIQATTTYQFQISRFGTGQPIPSNTIIQISFPNAYSTSTTAGCSPVDWPTNPSPSLFCTLVALKLRVEGAFPTTSSFDSFKFQATDITNPFPASTYGQFTVSLIFPNGTSQEGTGGVSVTITTGTATCTPVITNGIVSSRGTIAITYASTYITNPSADNYKLKINMAQSYPSDSSNNDVLPVINVTSNQVGSYLFNMDYTTSFEITLLMPPSTQPQQNFITLTSSVDNGDIDTCSITIDGIVPNQFTQLAISAAQVQSTSNLTFSLQSSSFVLPSDSILIDFTNTDFNTVGVSALASFSGGVIGLKEISVSNSKITITGISDNPLINTNLVFTIQNVGLPFTSAAQSIQLSLQTGTGYLRDLKTMTYSATPGSLADLQVSCFNVEIGQSTSCSFGATLIHRVQSADKLIILFPNDFSIGSSNQLCTGGSNINPSPTCTSIPSNRTIQITSFTSQTQLSAGTAINFTIPITQPSPIGTFTIQLRTSSNGGIIDAGTTTITTTKRRLTIPSQFGLQSSVMVTSTQTTITINLALPLSYGFRFSLLLQIPLLTNGQSPSVNTSTITSSFSNSILTIENLQGTQTLSITNFITHSSTLPITLNGNFTSNNEIYFFFPGYELAMDNPKQISVFSFSQSSGVVGSIFIMQFNVSDLVVGDLLLFQNVDYYSSVQGDCSSNLVCNLNGRVQVTQVSAQTTININLLNNKYIGTRTVNLTIYQTTGTYKKQTHQYNITTNQLNLLTIEGEQTNPYYREESIYTFNVSLSTNPTTQSNFFLTVNFPSYAYRNCTCLSGCSCGSAVGTDLTLAMSSTNIRFQMGLTNPLSSFTTITMTSSSSLGQMDQGTYTPTPLCNNPCRACTTNLPDNCLNCYSWQTLNILRGTTCVSSCIVAGQYHRTSTSSCQACDSKCTGCQTSATNCSGCNNPYLLHNNSCLSACPTSYFADVNQCTQCAEGCARCTSVSVCLQCDSNGTRPYLYNSLCLVSCADGTYTSNVDNICIDCPQNCALCNRTHCTECSSGLLSQGQCIGDCIDGTFRSTNTTCQLCVSPCATCSALDVCLTCQLNLNLYQSACLSNCPARMYSSNGFCQDCPANCGSCFVVNGEVRCSECDPNTFFYGYLCQSICPENTTQQSLYCVSAECSSLPNCLSCSSLKCLSCASSYYLNSSTNACSEIVEDTTTITEVSQIPVPFPFVIALILIIIMAFLIQSKFDKMYAPLFIYALGGLAEVGALALLIVLTYLRGIQDSNLGVLLRWVISAIGGVYVLFNILSFILYVCRIRKDRKYKSWQRQQNQCSSCTITLIGFLFSFRFSLLKYSRLGHLQAFSATLSSDNRLSHYNGMGVASILLISVPTGVMSAWIGYLQTQMNYLFFTCIENGIVSVIMIVICIAQLLTPKGFVLEKKEEFKQGHDSENLEGQSLEQIMMGINVVEEEYHEGKEIQSMEGQEVVQRLEDEHFTDGQVQTQTAIKRPSDTKIEFDVREHMNILSIIEERQELQNVLGQAERHAQFLNRPSRPVGSIRKQLNTDLISQSSQSEEIESSQNVEDIVPQIDNPIFSFSPKKKKKMPVIEEDEEIPIDDEERMENKKGMSKIKELVQYLEEQEKHEQHLRKRLEMIDEDEKILKEKEFEKAKELMERNRMTVEDKLSRLNQMFEDRSKREAERKKKLEEIEERRKEERQLNQKPKIQLKDLVYDPVQSDSKEDLGIKKVKVSKNPISDDVLWPQTQDNPNFEQNEWQIAQEHITPQYLREQKQLSQLSEPSSERVREEDKRSPELQNDKIDSEPNEDFWPIDPQLHARVRKLQVKADKYMKRLKTRTIIDYYDGSDELDSTPSDKFIYQEEEKPKEQMGGGEQEQLPKGKTHRTVKNLAPE